MQLRPFSPNFLIKVPKQEEIDKRERVGEVYLHPSFVWMTRNTQCGIIHNISKEAHLQLPDAKVGDILITHHFVQGSHSINESGMDFLVHEDDTYNYYNVVAKEGYGKNNQSYAVYNGKEIIPHKQYVFLEKEFPKEIVEDEYIETPDDVQSKLESIKAEIMSLAKTRNNPEIAIAIQKKEREQLEMGKKMHKKEYIKVKVAYANPLSGLKNGSIVYALTLGCATIVEFNNVEYRIAELKYIAATD